MAFLLHYSSVLWLSLHFVVKCNSFHLQQHMTLGFNLVWNIEILCLEPCRDLVSVLDCVF